MSQNYWWKNTTIYEVYVDKFAGNFKGMADKLPYLKNLGIDCIWILPHYPSPMIDDGYDVSDYMNVRSSLGTLADFEEFVRKSHEIGIRVIIDFVLNHVSTEHPWFREASQSRDNPKRDFFLWSETAKEFPDAVNPFSHMKPSNWILNEATEDYYFASFYPQQADLNWDNPQVFTEMMKIADFWLSPPAGGGVDGFRLDAAPFLIKREGTQCVNLPETHAILKKFRAHLELKNPQAILLAEANGPFEKIVEYFGRGDECHMIFNFHLMSAMFLALKRGDMSIVKDEVDRSANIPDNCQWATFLRNHDELTLSHVAPETRDELLHWLDPEEKYHFKGGHGTSMRLGEIFKGDKEKIVEALKMLVESPGSPVMYYGDEIGMKNLDLPVEPLDSREYVRASFDWSEADSQMNDPESLLNKVKKLLRARA